MFVVILYISLLGTGWGWASLREKIGGGRVILVSSPKFVIMTKIVYRWCQHFHNGICHPYDCVWY